MIDYQPNTTKFLLFERSPNVLNFLYINGIKKKKKSKFYMIATILKNKTK